MTVRALSAAFIDYCHCLTCLSLCMSLFVCLCAGQLHFALFCDGALEELGGYARAGLSLQRLSRHWLRFGKGEEKLKLAQLAKKTRKGALFSDQ